MKTKQITITAEEEKGKLSITVESKNINKLELIGLLHEVLKIVNNQKDENTN
jgi:hypothetical protein